MEGLLRAGETADELRPGGVRIIQGEKGYRFSLDPVLLCAFARVRSSDHIADLGTGAGVMPLLLASRGIRIVGVEIQPDLADRARRSVLLNGLEEWIRIVEGDVRRIGEILAPRSFDVVLANPPYRRPESGRRASGAERSVARHELAGGLGDFLRSASFILRHGGRLFLVHIAERLAEVLAEMRREGVEPKRLRCVHSRAGEPASLVLIEGRRGGRPGLEIESPLFVYEGREYSTEVLRIYGEGGDA